MPDALGLALRALAKGESLSARATAAAFDVIMSGEAGSAQIGAMLFGLRVKGESSEELAGVVQSLRDAMTPVPIPDAASLVDTCGTGGGAIGTFNISTAAAFVAAGAGVRIAKHGNRSFTSRCGSADVLEALGVSLDVPAVRCADVMAAAGMVFMFAPAFHPAMRHVGPVRRELGVHTVMNLVGPLANPARVLRQVIGVAERRRVRSLAEALQHLGARHVLVVHGEPGLDELSPLGSTHVAELRDGAITEWTVDPAALGLAAGVADDLAGGDAARNAALVLEVLGGGGSVGARNAVLLNAAAAVYVSGGSRDFAEAVARARASLDARAGLAVLEKLVRATAGAART